VNELAARIADGWSPDLTPAEKAAMETDLHAMQCREPAGECVQCMKTWHAVRKYINAARRFIEAEERARLAGEGSLHPAGSEHRLQVVLRWFRADGTHDDRGGPDDWTVADALEMAKTLPAWAVRWEIRVCEHWDAPWQVVEEGNADGDQP
jgi:hypothetical protein